MARATQTHAVETRTDRAVLAEHAGFGRVSLASVLAGTLVAYGAFAVLLAITAAVAKSMGLETDLTTNEWRGLGAVGGAVVAAVLLVCYLFGGYVAGRMARRAGATNGLMVFVLGVVVAAGVAGLVNVFTDGDEIVGNLRNVGVPTSADEWRDIGTVAGIGSLVAMLLGSVVGGALGERWHAKLLARAADPTVGPEAEARAAAEHHRRELRRAEERARESRLAPVDTEPGLTAISDAGDTASVDGRFERAPLAYPTPSASATTVDDDEAAVDPPHGRRRHRIRS
ncbi:MAG TPA: hypothetical protein VHM89_01630 [Acidimicrobiales bacterium]|nr:hypothetical protein [Acidimicrobiales bacterium]